MPADERTPGFVELAAGKTTATAWRQPGGTRGELDGADTMAPAELPTDPAAAHEPPAEGKREKKPTLGDGRRFGGRGGSWGCKWAWIVEGLAKSLDTLSDQTRPNAGCFGQVLALQLSVS